MQRQAQHVVGEPVVMVMMVIMMMVMIMMMMMMMEAKGRGRCASNVFDCFVFILYVCHRYS